MTKDRAPGRAPDRDAGPILSSIARRAAPPALLLLALAVGAAAATLAPQDPVPAPIAAGPAPALPGVPPRTDPLWPAIDEWDRLRQSDRLPFEDYARFLAVHRGWPGEMALRRAAERQIRPDQADPARLVAFFTALPPVTSAGRVRHAEALAAVGRTGEARDAAAAAWTAGALSADDEGRITARFAGQFTPAEQDQRMERLLWSGATASAARQLALVTPGRHPIYAARLALQTRATDAALLAAALGPQADRDPGFVVDRAQWLRDTGQWTQARTYLAQPRTLDAPPLDAQHYLQTLLAFARAAATDGQAETAYAIAVAAPGAFAAGTDISQRPLPERDAFTSLIWLGATNALKTLGRPRDAERMFALYAASAQTPGSQARGLYWAGRAAQAAGDRADADTQYARAAANIDQFYGQLAVERLGRTIAVPPDPPAPAISPEVRAAFDQSEVVRAARLLGQQRQWQEQTQFVREIALNAKSDTDHVLAGELARALARPDLGVILSRQARVSGTRDPIRVGFPQVPVPPAMASHWTMIHAITRQESQFDREALSPAGAHGLMQLMNPTAREQAGKLGLPWEPRRLIDDIGYNVLIGSSFFDRLLTSYGGNYVLAVAAYNAGPGNVNRFIRANGDPRSPQVDVIDWIEAIPLAETRAYVQKVLENAVVYDLFNPDRAHTPEKDRLSFYLGKTGAG